MISKSIIYMLRVLILLLPSSKIICCFNNLTLVEYQTIDSGLNQRKKPKRSSFDTDIVLSNSYVMWNQ